MGLEKSSALESLKSPDNNQVKVAYQLLLDQRQLADSAGEFFLSRLLKNSSLDRKVDLGRQALGFFHLHHQYGTL